MKKILVVLISIIVIPLIITNFFYEYKIKKISTGLIEQKEVKIRVLKKDNSIITLNLEDYLVGVVSAEMPVSFEIEALKSQAVAARTYALKRIKSNKENTYDVTDDTSSQVYQTEEDLKNKWKDKYDEYKNKIQKAVDETKGEYLTYKDEIIYAFFFSSSNGKTEDNKEVFGQDLPYLKVVDSSFEDNETPSNVATKTFEMTEFYQKLGIPFSENVIIKDKILTISGRVKNITINNNIFKGTEIRNKLALRSTDFTIEKCNNEIRITTKGYGHGVGMSQYGANALAKQNKTYSEILEYYYQGTKIKKL